jgi:hypothetical protein
MLQDMLEGRMGSNLTLVIKSDTLSCLFTLISTEIPSMEKESPPQAQKTPICSLCSHAVNYCHTAVSSTFLSHLNALCNVTVCVTYAELNCSQLTTHQHLILRLRMYGAISPVTTHLHDMYASLRTGKICLQKYITP